MIRVVVLAVLATGCLKTAAYPCSQQADCLRGGEQGVCEITGFCSFVDGSCPDGRRYGDLSGSLANTCVGDEPPTDGPLTDAVTDTPVDMAAAPFCDAANEPTLVGCWEFENTLTDASGDNNDGTGTNVAFATGKVGMAAQLVTASHIALADTASLSPPTLTIEGWIDPTAIPATGRMGIFDNDGSYGLFLEPTGLQCALNTNTFNVTVTITPGTFTHVACTFDGTTGRVYVDGSEVAMAGGGTPLGTGTTSGAAIAGNSPSADTLVGKIDQLRIWRVARSAAQICAAAGHVTCP